MTMKKLIEILKYSPDKLKALMAMIHHTRSPERLLHRLGNSFLSFYIDEQE